MSAVAFAMRDMYPAADGRTPAGAVCVPTHRGGCGTPHEVFLTDDKRGVIECDRCAPVLVGGTYGWSSDAAGVPQTPDELRANDLAARDAKTNEATVMSAMTQAFVEAIKNGGFGAVGAPEPVKQPSLVEQIASMSAEDRAQLAGLLGAPQAQNPARLAKAEDADLTPDEVKAPAKRSPGRPRTVTR